MSHTFKLKVSFFSYKSELVKDYPKQYFFLVIDELLIASQFFFPKFLQQIIKTLKYIISSNYFKYPLCKIKFI